MYKDHNFFNQLKFVLQKYVMRSNNTNKITVSVMYSKSVELLHVNVSKNENPHIKHILHKTYRFLMNFYSYWYKYNYYESLIVVYCQSSRQADLH